MLESFPWEYPLTRKLSRSDLSMRAKWRKKRVRKLKRKRRKMRERSK